MRTNLRNGFALTKLGLDDSPTRQKSSPQKLFKLRTSLVESSNLNLRAKMPRLNMKVMKADGTDNNPAAPMKKATSTSNKSIMR